MINPPLPKEAECAILDSLQRIGYANSMIDQNIQFNILGVTSRYLEPVPLAAFWGSPFDQLTSAIGVRYLLPAEHAGEHVGALGKYLWVPYSIVARPDCCEIWESLPTNGLRQPVLLEDSVSYSDLASRLEIRREQLNPGQIRERKLRWRQMSLYEIAKEPTAFFDWAFCPTRDQLRHLLRKALKEGMHNHLDTPVKVERLRWLLRFIGVRIAWDKGWLQCLSRRSPSELVTAASQYPVPLRPPAEARELAERFIDSIGASVNLRIADGGLLSQILQTNGLIEDLRREWKLYPTPPDIAWEMVDTIPMEAVPEEKRLVWDGTCGTGTLMVVSMERLRQISDRYVKEPEQLTLSLMGNDREPLLADLSRIALDTALGKLQGPNWQIHTSNVLDFGIDTFAQRPNIIVGNPPFEARGPGADKAMEIIERYIDILEPGGVLAVVLPRTLLGATGRHAVGLREKLIRGFEIYELWELPQGFAPNVSSEAAIICGRKRYPHELQRSAVVWKLFEPHRRTPPLTDVVSSPDVWLQSKHKAMESPLMLRLRGHFQDFRVLSDVVSRKRITEGIRTGAAGSIDILMEEEEGAHPFLRGRTDMVPFYIPWHQRPRWIRYDSPRLDAPRRQYEFAFKQRKVLITRWSTGGSPWAGQAAVDEHGLYPSDDFISISPEPMLSCKLVAGLFNSALINCWLRMSNPSRTIRVGECATIPVPVNWSEHELQKIEELARRLSFLRQELAGNPSERKALLQQVEESTLELDEAVYDAYRVPEEVRAEVSDYLVRHGKPRPGFDRPLLKEREIKIAESAKVFTEDHGQRMIALLEARKQRDLSQEETDELEILVARWEKAQVLSSTRELSREHPEWARSMASSTGGEAL